MKNIFIILMDSGTHISRLFKVFTHDKFNHVSICLDADLDEMYSFARRIAYFFPISGFIKESPLESTLARFFHIDSVILKLEITDEQYDVMCSHIKDMYRHRFRFHFDYLGLVMASVGKRHRTEHFFYCSAFVSALLEKFGTVRSDILKDILKPMDFLSANIGEKIFEGDLRQYYLMRHQTIPEN